MVDLAVARGERHAVLGDPADLDAAVRLIEDRERRPGWPRRPWSAVLRDAKVSAGR
jgi:hypothetical protein